MNHSAKLFLVLILISKLCMAEWVLEDSISLGPATGNVVQGSLGLIDTVNNRMFITDRFKDNIQIVDLDIEAVIANIRVGVSEAGGNGAIQNVMYSYQTNQLFVHNQAPIADQDGLRIHHLYIIDCDLYAITDTIVFDYQAVEENTRQKMVYDYNRQTILYMSYTQTSRQYSPLHTLSMQTLEDEILLDGSEDFKKKLYLALGSYNANRSEIMLQYLSDSDPDKMVLFYDPFLDVNNDTLHFDVAPNMPLKLNTQDSKIYISQIPEDYVPGQIVVYDIAESAFTDTISMDGTPRNMWYCAYDEYAQKYYMGFQRIIKVLDKNYNVIGEIPNNGGLAINRKHQKLYFGNSNDKGDAGVVTHDLNNLSFSYNMILGAEITDLLILENENAVLVLDKQQGKLTYLNGNTLNLEKELNVGFFNSHMTLDTTSNLLYISKRDWCIESDGSYSEDFIYVVDIDTWSIIYTFDQSNNINELNIWGPIGLDINYNTHELWVSHHGRRITIINLDDYLDMSQIDEAAHGTGGTWLKVDNKNNLVYKAGGNNIAIYDGTTYNLINTIEIGDVTNIALSYTQDKMFLNYHCWGITVLDLNSHAWINTISTTGGACVYSTNKPMYISDLKNLAFITQYTGSDSLYIIDTENDIMSQTLPVRFGASAVSMNEKTNMLYVANQLEGVIKVYSNPDIPGVQPPSPPVMLEPIAGDNQITLVWEPSNAADSYNLYKYVANTSEYQKINSSPISNYEYTDIGLTNGIQYSYAVTASDMYNIESGLSNASSAIPIELPDFEIVPDNQSLTLTRPDSSSYTFNIIYEAQFSSSISISAISLPQGIYLHSNLSINMGDAAELVIYSDLQAEVGTQDLIISASGGGQTHLINLELTISDGYALTCIIAPENPKIGEAIVIYGSIDPGESQNINTYLINPRGIQTDTTIQSDIEGNYQLIFTPEESGNWIIGSNVSQFNMLQSDSNWIEISRGDSRISCTTDLSDSASGGWPMTIRGRVFPPPGMSTCTITVIPPDGSLLTIYDIVINELGYYGHNIPADQTGLWTINVSWPGNDTYLGAEGNTLTVPVGLGVGLGILVRAQTDGSNIEYDQSMDSLSSSTYQVLNERRFTDGMIYYLNPDETLDLDDDGFADEVDDQPTLAALEYAVTTWAKETVNDSVSLSLYLVGPGTAEGFQINESEVLSPADLNTWLTVLEDSTGTHINVIFETDHGLGFPDALSNQNRTIITSTDTTSWNAYDSGQISFSRLFWNGIFTGMSVGEAFLTTKDQMVSMPELFGNQLPQIETNGTQIHNEQNDYDFAGNVFIGGTYLLGDFPPDMVGGGTTEGGGGLLRYVNPALPYQTSLSRASTFGIRLWTQINDESPDELDVRALVSAPESERVTIQSMTFAGDGIYEAYLTEFDNPGMYDVFIYATDQSGHMSDPIRKQLFLTAVDLDFIAPDLGIGLLQNPLFDDYLDLYVLSSEQLSQTPTAELNGVDLVLTEVPQLSQNAYYSQIVMDVSGQSTIRVIADDLNSNRTTSNLSFGLSKVLAKGTTDIEVPESSVNLSVPEGAVYTDSKVLLTSISPSDLTLLAPLNTDYSINDSSITPVHIFTADFSSNLASPITLKTDPMTNSDATFYELTSQGWFSLDTYVDDDRLRWAFTDHEGTFALARGNGRAIYVPTALKLNQNYPNPFNASTYLKFEIPSGHTWTASGSRPVQLDVYNILGQNIVTLINKELSPGQYQVSWSGLDVEGKLMSSGVYFARLRMGDKLITNKMLLLK